MGTRVVTGNAACGGGDKGAEAGAGAGARGTASGSRGAGSKGGPTCGSWIEAGKPEAEAPPT